MTKNPISDTMFSPTVKAWQEENGSRVSYARMEEKGGFRNTIDDYLTEFIGHQDSFYLGTASPDGQPYIQHRGGKKGFLKVLDDKTLGFADFRGNKQYISAGNLEDNPKAYIFLMDYAARRRIKIWGEARVVEDDPALLKKLFDDDYRAVPERAIVFTITAWDINCPQHIPQKFGLEEFGAVVEPLKARIAELEEALGKNPS